MICDSCNRTCQCSRHLHTGEAKALIGLTKAEIEHLLAGCGNYALAVKLERARDLLEGAK